MMPTPDTCTEDDVRNLVYAFYAKVRCDEVLGKMVDFWSAILRGTARYHGTPMPKHAVLPDLSAELFQRWLGLFRTTTGSLANAAMRARAEEMAQRIAQSLWFGYQLHRNPDASPSKLAASPG